MKASGPSSDLLAAAVFAGLFLFASPANAVDKVSLQLRWDHQFQFAGYYAAQWQGYYAEAGIEVDIRSAITAERKTLNSITEVVEGRADFGIGAGDILVARGKGAPLAVAASIFQRSQVGIFAKRETGLASPADLTRLKVRRVRDDLADVELQAVLEAEGIDPKSLPAVTVEEEAGRTFNLLAEGKIDAYAGYTLTTLWRARQAEFALTTLRPALYGVDFYGDSLFVHQRLAQENPELVQRFVAATLKGWAYALDHPEEVAERITDELPRRFPIKNLLGFNRFQAEEVKKLTLHPVVRLGNINPDRWRRMYETIRSAGLIAAPIDLSTLIFDYRRHRQEQQTAAVRGTAITLAAILVLSLVVGIWLWSFKRIEAAAPTSLPYVFLLVLTAAIAALILAFDLFVPLGIAGGVPYVALVLLGSWYPRRRHTFALAFLGSALTALGYILSTGAGIPWMVLANRALALFAIWITAFLIVYRKSMERELRRARDQLEKRVEERTRELSDEIGERKRAEEQLRKLSRAVEQNPSMVFITDTEGIIEYVNAKFTEMTGYSQQEAIGNNPRILKSEETPAEVHEDLWRTITRGREWRHEIKDRRKDGTLFWAYATISPVRSPEGVITHYVAMHEDITERKEAEEAVRLAKEQAEIANRAKSELLANMSHELRTPLNAILGFASSIREEVFGPIDNDKYLEYVADIYGSGEHLLELINDILDVSAIEAGKLELREENLDIAVLAEGVIRLLHPRANKGGVSIHAAIDKDLPSIFADERRFKQILLNLLSNAVKFTGEGGAVTLEAKVGGNGSLDLTITDTGIGMDAKGIAKAMTEFGQVDGGLDRKYEGTGLGLSLTKGLVEIHDGKMTINSEKEVGTTVTITFPPDRVRYNA